MLTTPLTINANVLRLREKIGITTEPVFVPVSLTDGNKIDDCFPNVKRKIANDGGSIQHGWMIWEWPGQLVEGEFHAVWVAPDGNYVDITPKPDGERRILFIPDPDRVYEDDYVDTIRLPLTDDPAILLTIQFNEEMQQLRRKYNDGSGEAKIPTEELIALRAKYSASLPQPQIRTAPKVGRNDPCPCGSGKKFKRCHGSV